jgi:calpain family cysteine protease
MTTSIDIDGARRRTDWSHDDPPEPPPGGDAANERAGRAAASERYDAFVSSDPSDATWDPNTCVAAPVPNPVLFAKEGTDADAVDLHDVQQRNIGDCYLLAPLAALARTPEGRAFIQNAITENKNDHGDVVSYTVTLHRPEWHVVGPKTFTDVNVTVSGPFACGHAEARTGGNQNEVWPLVVEKAYAQYRGRYEHGGVVSNGMEVLTGREPTHINLRWFGSYSPDQLKSDLTAGKMVVLSTRKMAGDDGMRPTTAERAAHCAAYNLYGSHAYVVTGTEEQNGKLYLQLHNPWNDQEPDLVPYDELKTWFASVDIGSVN